METLNILMHIVLKDATYWVCIFPVFFGTLQGRLWRNLINYSSYSTTKNISKDKVPKILVNCTYESYRALSIHCNRFLSNIGKHEGFTSFPIGISNLLDKQEVATICIHCKGVGHKTVSHRRREFHLRQKK